MKYIFEIRIKQGHTAEEYAAAWKRGSEILQTMPGALGTRLHHKIGDPNTLLAIAEWESKEARDTAMAELQNSDDRTKEIAYRHRAIADFAVIGEYDDPEWVVLP